MLQKMSRITLLLVFVFVWPFQPLTAHEDEPHETAAPARILGVLDFPNSGSETAQAAFEQGILLLHSFEFDDSRSAFLEAQVIDPDFVMAIWGEAMTLNHPLWAAQDRDAALQALAKLPPPDERTITAREEMYLDAVETLYGAGDKPLRDIAYMQAMQALYQAYPDDLDAASFYALSILGSVYERDFRTYMRAAAILEEVFAKEPRHPGAAHYLIHSYDDQVHAPLGLRAARVYAQIAPGAAHAQHMVSHIYTSLGMWDEVITANREAVRVSEESMLRAKKPIAKRNKHALHWLEYALLQQGRFDEAKETLAIIKQDFEADPSLGQTWHYAMMRGSWVSEDPLKDAAMPSLDTAELPMDGQVLDRFSSGLMYVANAEFELARTELAKIKSEINAATVLSVEEGLHEDENATSEDGYLLATIMSRSLESLLLFHSGHMDSAVSLLEAAAADENSRPLYYGPPHVPKPSSELLGEMLLTLDRPVEAAVHFQLSLDHHTGRTRSLLGLARAAHANGDQAGASDAWNQVKANWKGDLDSLKNSDYAWFQKP